MDEFIKTLGLVGSACVGVSLVPQVSRTVKAGHADQISPTMIGLMTFASISMVVYGCYFRVLPVVIANGSVGLNALTILYYKIWRTSKGGRVHGVGDDAAASAEEGVYPTEADVAQQLDEDAQFELRSIDVSDEDGIARKGVDESSLPLLKRTNSMPVVYPRPGSGKIPVEQEWTPKRRPLAVASEPTGLGS